jgi:hypothetical protein
MLNKMEDDGLLAQSDDEFSFEAGSSPCVVLGNNIEKGAQQVSVLASALDD